MNPSTAGSIPGSPSRAKKTLLFCVPGRSFSNRFLMGWTETLHALLESGEFNVLLSNQYASCVHIARAACLGLAVDRGPTQKPFDGKVPYDVLVWIDSDIVFRPRDVADLIQATEHYPLVSGIYMMEDRVHYCAVEKWDTDYYLKNDCTFEFLTQDRIREWTRTTGSAFMPCAYAGLGFCAFRYGVLEDPRLQYPYFYTPLQTIPTGRADVPEYRDLSSEDVSLFRNLTEAGIVPHVMVKTDLRVGHEKSVVL
jgi:hypothetical protein